LDSDSQRNEDFFLPDFCGLRMMFGFVVIAELFALILALAPLDHSVNLRWQNLGLISLLVQWCALGAAAALCAARPYLHRLSNVQSVIVSYLLVLVIIVLVSEAAYLLVTSLDLLRLEHWEFLVRNILIGAIITGPILRYFYVQHQWRRRIEAESRARFQALQSRIRPHFLFNSMNTIASLIRTQPNQAELAVENLSDLFRASLRDAAHHFTLAEELELCQRYVQIEQLRIGEGRLRVDWETASLPADALIPPLTLQPLLENAIYHGIGSLPDGGTVTIEGALNRKQIELKLTNPISRAGLQKLSSGNQVAQENIRERLQAFYQRGADIWFNESMSHYEAVLRFPYMKQADENSDR